MTHSPTFRTLVTGAALAVSVAGAAQAADPDNGRKLARQCSVCHGKDGIAKDPEVPNLAGQSAFYTEKALKDFQSGAREDRRMTLMANRLSDEQIADIAAWYESIEVVATVPQK